jgi:serine/threonine protein kinase/Tfp pilus assembly protein PilF
MIGKTISHYEILEKLGEGGMGVVYKAEDTKLRRTVALKFLSPQSLRTEDEKTRFLHEAQAAAALSHTNICTIFEIDEVQEQAFIVMECIDGQSLKNRIESAPLRLDEAIGIAIQVVEGLQKAHEKGIVHRDVKSANIMVTSDGQPKIMDFGLAKSAGSTKVTKMGTTVGTIAYMSPEQTRGDPLDHRTDVWSLGVVLYEMLTGRLPFRGDYEQAIIYSILNHQPEPITALRMGVPTELDRIVGKALSKIPGERYQSMKELEVDLRALRKRLETGDTKEGITLEKPGRKSIAVLPFKNMVSDPENEWFSDGITEDIITQLAKIGELKVISRTSVMLYKDSRKNLRQIGEELGVATVLEGSVRRAGNRIRVVSQLIDARTDEHIWAETYDSDMKDIFDIQSSIALQIAVALKAELSPKEKERIEKKPTENLTAYDYYLRGREYYYRYRKQDNDGAIELFKRALELDPNYALAYAGLGDAYAQAVDKYGYAETWLDSAIEAGMKALSIDPNLAEAHKALGLAYSSRGFHQKALESNEKAVALDPNYVPAVANLGWIRCYRGELDAGLRWMKKALARNPRFATNYCAVAFVYMLLNDYEQAEHWFKRGLEIDPHSIFSLVVLCDLYLLRGELVRAEEQSRKSMSVQPDSPHVLARAGIVELLSGRLSEAREYLEKAMSTPRLVRPEWGPQLAYVCQKMGREEEARALFNQSLDLARRRIEQGNESWENPMCIAMVNAARGNKTEAYLWLKKAIDAGWRNYQWVSIDPLFAGVRDDEEFRQIMAGVKVSVDEMRRRVEEE